MKWGGEKINTIQNRAKGSRMDLIINKVVKFKYKVKLSYKSCLIYQRRIKQLYVCLEQLIFIKSKCSNQRYVFFDPTLIWVMHWHWSAKK